VIEFLAPNLTANHTGGLIPPSVIMCQEPKVLDSAAIFTM